MTLVPGLMTVGDVAGANIRVVVRFQSGDIVTTGIRNLHDGNFGGSATSTVVRIDIYSHRRYQQQKR